MGGDIIPLIRCALVMAVGVGVVWWASLATWILRSFYTACFYPDVIPCSQTVINPGNSPSSLSHYQHCTLHSDLYFYISLAAGYFSPTGQVLWNVTCCAVMWLLNVIMIGLTLEFSFRATFIQCSVYFGCTCYTGFCLFPNCVVECVCPQQLLSNLIVQYKLSKFKICLLIRCY